MQPKFGAYAFDYQRKVKKKPVPPSPRPKYNEDVASNIY